MSGINILNTVQWTGVEPLQVPYSAHKWSMQAHAHWVVPAGRYAMLCAADVLVGPHYLHLNKTQDLLPESGAVLV